MFSKEVYIRRRNELLSRLRRRGCNGLVLFLGNAEAPVNYRGNDYKFRQDSTWIYYFGLDESLLAATIDLSDGDIILYGNDVDIDDIIWMGPQPSVVEKGESVGISLTRPYKHLYLDIQNNLARGRNIHFLPPSRYYNEQMLCSLLSLPVETIRRVGPCKFHSGASIDLVEEVIDMRLIKEECEIEALNEAAEIGYEMHTAARNAVRPGIIEQEVVGKMEGVTLQKGWGTSFPSILSQRGETLHNHRHDLVITPGNLLIVDAGAEANSHYASDFTRTLPTGGKFTTRQREIYDIVASCNDFAFSITRPGITYSEVHVRTMAHMLEGLKALGLVHGDVAEMNALGVSGLFQPHGLGHNMGLDVHDMEDLGEDRVGYDKGQKRSSLLGLGSLRMARCLRPGHVISDEPGIYFIPQWIEQLRAEGFAKDMVNYEALESYYGFGGIRLEDDVLVTATGAVRPGTRRLPITSSEVEEAMRANFE